MISWFFNEFTPEYPYLSSAIKFAILGTFGEWLGMLVRKRSKSSNFGVSIIISKILIWAILGVWIKWAFSSFALLVTTQAQVGLLPANWINTYPLARALATSIELNIFFAPAMMFFHRVLDNIIAAKWTLEGMNTAFVSILWFWIPAHTITFLLPPTTQIFFAAVLGVVLGLLMGFTNRKG